MCCLIYQATNVGKRASTSSSSGSDIYNIRLQILLKAQISDISKWFRRSNTLLYCTGIFLNTNEWPYRQLSKASLLKKKKLETALQIVPQDTLAPARVNWFHVIAPLRSGLEGHWGKLILVGRIWAINLSLQSRKRDDQKYEVIPVHSGQWFESMVRVLRGN